MSAFKIRNAANTGWIDGATASSVKFRNTANSGWITKAGLSGVSVRNSTNSGWLTFSSPPPTQLSLAQNDLDFYYYPTPVTSSVNTTTIEMICVVDSSSFYSNATSGSLDHIAFCIDATGEQGTSNPHCGPIIRNGRNLWSTGRGFILWQDGSVMAEEWNGTFSPGLSASLGSFSWAANPSVRVQIIAGYRAGPWANEMRIVVRNSSTYITLLDATVPWGWDWSGNHTGAIAAIGNGFVKPVDTGCVENLSARADYLATVPFSSFTMATY